MNTSALKYYDYCVVGAGIIGLSTAYHLSQLHPKPAVLIIEKEHEPSIHQTGRNSGVIHSGIYYKPGSLKAQFCRRGLAATYKFCKEHKISYKKTGKLIVAKNSSEHERLSELKKRSLLNGLIGVEDVSAHDIQKYEHFCRGTRALHVPETGVVDYVQMAGTIMKLFIASGGLCLFGAKVTCIDADSGLIKIEQKNQNESQFNNLKINSRLIINCAGVHADSFLSKKDSSKTKIIPFRGEYFSIKPSRAHLVNHLIYPVPDPRFPFLGVHFTRSVDDHVHVGPNAVLALAKEGYNKSDFNFSSLNYLFSPQLLGLAAKYPQVAFKEQVRSLSKYMFCKSAKEFISDLSINDLEPDRPGIRAQAVEGWGQLVDDFRIVNAKRVLHVINAPSPAATASLPIGEYITEIAVKNLL